MPNNQKPGYILTLPLKWGTATHKGKSREENQDRFAAEPELGLFVVSDGMGGHRGGKLAANIVTQDLPVMIETKLAALRSSKARAVRRLFKKTITEQSRQLRMEGNSESGYKDMGATLVLLLIKNRRAYMANLGDSRLYRLRKGRFAQLSRDHSVVSELVEKGKIEPEQFQNHDAAGQLTGYIGMEEKVMPFIRSLAIQKNDRFLLCTDGLTDMLNETDISAVLERREDPQSAAQALVEKANDAGGHDNITAVVVDWLGKG